MAERGINFNLVMGVALVGGAVWVVYQLMNKGSQAAAAVGQALVPFPTGTATIVLTDTGQTIAYSSAQWFYPSVFSGDFWSGNQHFTVNGVEYHLTNLDPDASNTYYAAPVSQ